MSKVRTFADCAWGLGRTPSERLLIFWKLTKNLRTRLGVARYRPDAVYQLPTRYGAVSLRDNFGDVTNLPDLLHRSVYRVNRLAVDGAVLDGARETLRRTWAVALETHGQELHRASIDRLRAAGLSIDADEQTRNGGLLFASRRSQSGAA